MHHSVDLVKPGKPGLRQAGEKTLASTPPMVTETSLSVRARGSPCCIGGVDLPVNKTEAGAIDDRRISDAQAAVAGSNEELGAT
ncbi:MAG: hypothetical protein R2748_23385 [Bryobacterales bacterium]